MLRNKARRTIPAPLEVAALIEAVNPFTTDWNRETNTLPPNWRPLADILEAAIKKPKGEHARLLLRAYTAAIEGYPAPIKRFIGPVQIDNLGEVMEKYLLLENSMSTLDNIARANSYRRPDGVPPAWVANAHFALDDKTGKLVPESGLMDILGEIDNRRIRRCLICRKLFWAGRLDKVCCTADCGRVWRARKWRKDHADEHRSAR